MKRKNYIPSMIVIFIAALAMFLQPAAAQAHLTKAMPTVEGGVSDPAELEVFLDAYLTAQMEKHHIPGVVITFVKDGEVFFSKGYGYANLEESVPMDVDETLLTTASLGKAFAAVGILQQHEQGVIDLHEDVRPYITEFELKTNFDEALTFANLLTHTDGYEARMIGIAARDEAGLITLEELIEAYTPNQLYPPGQYMTYGDFAASLSGYLTEEISGLPFEEYMANNILLPLDMTDSTFDQRLPDEMAARLAIGYDYSEGEYHPVPTLYIRSAPAGGLRTTAENMNTFMLALLNGGEYQGARILDDETVEMIFAQQFAPAPNMAGITYGLFEHFENDQRLLLRDGDGVGTRSRMVLLPDHDLGFFISYNAGDSNLRLDIVSDFLAHYYPVEDDVAPQPVADHQSRTRLFTGTYRPLQADATTFGKSMYFFSQLVEITATNEGYLSITTAGMGGEQSSVMGGFEGTSLWVEVEPLYFERVDGSGQLTFVEGESGKIVQMLSGQGYHSIFARLPWYESQSFQMILIQLVALLLISAVLSTFLGWPLGALIRKLRKQEPNVNTGWGANLARLWAGLVAGIFVLFAFRTTGVLYAIGGIAGMPNFIWGITPEMIGALNSIYIPVALALPLPIFTALAWGNRWWKRSTRIHYSLITLALLAGIWWMNNWNLLGFRL